MKRLRNILRCLFYWGALVAGVYLWVAKDMQNQKDSVLWKLWYAHLDQTIGQHVSQLPAVDRVDLLFLQDMASVADAETYAVPGDGNGSRYMYVAKTKSLEGNEAANLIVKWRQLPANNSHSIMCFTPHHAVKFYNEGKLVNETVLCFECSGVAIRDMFVWNVCDIIPVKAAEESNFKELRKLIEGAVGAYQQPPSSRPSSTSM